MIPTMGQGQTFCNITLQFLAPSRGLLYPLPEDELSSYRYAGLSPRNLRYRYAGLSPRNFHQYPEEYIVSKIHL